MPNQAAFQQLLNGKLRSILHEEEARKVQKSYESKMVQMNHEARKWYNIFLQHPYFWNLFDSKNILLFEADAVLCPNPTLPLDWWAGRYAYVGGPWFAQQGAGKCWCKHMPCCVGNSGILLWHRPLIAGMLTNGTLKPNHGRLVDYWIAREVQNASAFGLIPNDVPPVPTEEIAGAFATGEPPDYWYGSETYTPVGVHGARNWPITRADRPDGDVCGGSKLRAQNSLAYGRCLALLASCPAIKAIMLNESLAGEL